MALRDIVRHWRDILAANASSEVEVVECDEDPCDEDTRREVQIKWRGEQVPTMVGIVCESVDDEDGVAVMEDRIFDYFPAQPPWPHFFFFVANGPRKIRFFQLKTDDWDGKASKFVDADCHVVHDPPILDVDTDRLTVQQYLSQTVMHNSGRAS